MKYNLHFKLKTPLHYERSFSMKKLITIIFVLSIIFTFVACKDKTVSNKTEDNKTTNEQGNDTNKDQSNNIDKPKADTASREDWGTISGSFVRDDSSQYNNAVLQLKYLDNDCVMFEFRLMTGSESEDSADTLVIPSVLIVDDDGIGHYESLSDSEKPIKIEFILSKDMKSVSITHQGEVDISPDGIYTFVDNKLEVSEVSATSIIDFLPTAATSLNSNNGEYIIEYPDALVSDWFYPVKAVFVDSKKVIAKFIVAKDLSAVYRVDDDIEPILIFGTAQPMLDATTMTPESDFPEDDETGELIINPIPIVNVEIEDGVFFLPAQSSKLIVTMPWDLPYAIEAVSSDSSIIEVEKDGTIIAISMGKATISGTLTIDDGIKAFSIEIEVGNPKAEIPEIDF